MPYANPVVNGTALAVPAIKSPNYIPGVSGWAIFRDGSAEFASGTFRGPIVVIDPTTGAILASIGATGNGSFQVVQANDFILNGVSLAGLTAKQGKGLIASVNLTGALPSSGNNVFVDTAWIEFLAENNRMYRIYHTPTEVVNPGGPVGVDQIQQRFILSSPNGGTAATVYTSRTDVDEQETISPSIIFRSLANATQRVQLAALGVGVVMTFPNNNNSFTFIVEDVGSFNSATHVGGSGTQSGATQRTTKYVATASRSYDGNGNPIPSPDADNNMYAGDSSSRPSAYNFERSMWVFPGATIRSDLSGATIQAARIWIYCFNCDGSVGDILYQWLTNSSTPTTEPGSGFGGQQISNIFPLPGWGSIDILGTELNNITVSNANSIRMLVNALTQNPTAWRGFGFDSTLRPYIEITYTK